MSDRIIPLNIAVLTVSDTRTAETDTSGNLLLESLQCAGHKLVEKKIVADDLYHIRSVLSQWIYSNKVHVILTTGGTGFAQRDVTPQAVMPLLDKTIDGFGELFRHLSYSEIGTSTVQSRAFAGIANSTLIACLPGSTGACRTAWEGILKEQLNSMHRPCNFAVHLSTDHR